MFHYPIEPVRRPFFISFLMTLDEPVKEYKVLKKKKCSDTALTILKRLASQVKPILVKRSWKIKNLCEFFPTNPNLLGTLLLCILIFSIYSIYPYRCQCQSWLENKLEAEASLWWFTVFGIQWYIGYIIAWVSDATIEKQKVLKKHIEWHI